MVKVKGAKNFGIGLGLIVEDALFAVRLDFTIFQVEIECEGSIFLHDDQVTVIDLGCPIYILNAPPIRPTRRSGAGLLSAKCL